MRVAFGMRLRQAMIPPANSQWTPILPPASPPLCSWTSGMQNEFDFFLSERARAGKRKVDVSKTPTHKS